MIIRNPQPSPKDKARLKCRTRVEALKSFDWPLNSNPLKPHAKMFKTKITCLLVAITLNLTLNPIPLDGQFVSAINRPAFSSYDTGLFFNDFSTSSTMRLRDFEDFGIPLGTAPGFRGLAGDDANRRFFSISDQQVGTTTATNLYQIDYNGNATFITRPFQALPNGNAFMQLNGVAFDTNRGDLYVFRNLAQNLSSSLGGWIQGGLFRVDLTTGLMTATNLVGPAAGTNPINVREITYDNVTDRIYYAQSRVGTPLEIVSWDPVTGNTESILDLTTLGFTDSRVPIIGAGGGRLMLLSQAEGHLGGFHREFDLITREFTSRTIETPYGPYGIFAGSPVIPSGGIAYAPSIPEPSCVFLIGSIAAGCLLLRRRVQTF